MCAAGAREKLGDLVDEPLIPIDAPMIAERQQLLLDGHGKEHPPATLSTVREVMAKLSGVRGYAPSP